MPQTCTIVVPRKQVATCGSQFAKLHRHFVVFLSRAVHFGVLREIQQLMPALQGQDLSAHSHSTPLSLCCSNPAHLSAPKQRKEGAGGRVCAPACMLRCNPRCACRPSLWVFFIPFEMVRGYACACHFLTSPSSVACVVFPSGLRGLPLACVWYTHV